MSGRGGRAPSGPWSRLKAPNLDPLESYGLPSKGDNRLLDFKTQERYYTKIVDRYMSFCSQAGRGDELLRRMSSLHLERPPSPTSPSPSPSPTPTPTPASAATTTTTTITIPTPTPITSTTTTSSSSSPQPTKDLSTLLLALRKLREAIVATSRADTFAAQSYLFSIRLAILLRHSDSYHPALLYLLHVLHPRAPTALASAELAECVGYLVLDRACRVGDLGGAYAVRAAWGGAGGGAVRGDDGKVERVLRALVHDDYWAFWRVKRSVDGYRARVMEWAEDGVRGQALKCLGRTYLTAEVEFVESAAGGRSWEELVRLDRVGWELQGKKVVIRKVKGA